METVLKAIADWIKGILTAGIMSNLSGLFDDVNTQVGNIAQQVGTKPSNFEPRVFAMIEALSRNVVLPIAGIILTFIACYELIEMITQHNNMAQFEPALIMRWIFKTAVSVWFISNTFDIVMAVFDITQKVVSDSSGIIAGNTRVNDIGLSMLEASLMQMDVGPLFGLFLQSFFIGITMRILSIIIFVIVYKAAEKAQHLRFGKAELTPDELSRLTKAQKRELYAAAAARSAVHREVDQYEDENVGVQALSEGEKAAGNVRDISKSRYARKLKKKAKMQGKKGSKTAKSSPQEPTAPQDAGISGTGEGGSNWLSRWKQRQEIHKSYYAAARSGTAAQTAGGKAASNGASAARSGVEQAVEKGKTAASTAIKGLMNAAKSNAHVLVIVGVFILLILMVMSGFSSCGILFSGGTQVSGQTMYSAEDRDIRGAEQDYKKLEKELDKKIKRTPTDHPGYNEYQYHLDPIEHDPWQLTSFLTTLYDDYTRSEVQSKLKETFKKQYKLTTWVEVQIRYKTVWVISPAGIGHLVELAPPNVYDAKYVKWSIADLPILPERWQYLVSASTKNQFGILQKLMHRPDVDSVICATDAGREGELIFRLVYEQAGCKKPFSRLWLSSMEESAIREGFANLKPSIEYDALYNAALCRERADWMVGINASRLFSCLYGQPLAVGRVMTPVLAMTVVREAAIAAFVPERFYTVDLELTSGCTASSRRIPEKNVAENLLKACRKEMVATIQRITRKEKSENPPPLYDLTTLQRDANRLLGYSAQQTLNYVQSLYEKKLTTYPRTDSCYITDDDEEMLEELTEELERFLDITPADADEAVPRTRRTVNREKVTDHHAILPTRSMLRADLEALPKGEQNVLKLIIARTLMAVSKPFRYLETLLTTECAGEEFTAKGKEILEEGWKAVERKVLADILNRKQELTALPNAAENECGILNAELKEGQTSPPKHFTEDTLLHAMETASADSMPEGVERQGIGTPATRAATIEKLVQKGFLERKGSKKTKVLLPTDKGKALITVMPEEIQSPEMTADWETKLLRIERGEMEPETFMTEIKEMISSLVTTTEAAKGANTLKSEKGGTLCQAKPKNISPLPSAQPTG